jgi:hypothetical protein
VDRINYRKHSLGCRNVYEGSITDLWMNKARSCISENMILSSYNGYKVVTVPKCTPVGSTGIAVDYTAFPFSSNQSAPHYPPCARHLQGWHWSGRPLGAYRVHMNCDQVTDTRSST